jgi:hypothetical protein
MDVSLFRDEQEKTSKKAKDDSDTRKDINLLKLLDPGARDEKASIPGNFFLLRWKIHTPLLGGQALTGFNEMPDCFIFRNNIICHEHTHNKYMNYYTTQGYSAYPVPVPAPVRCAP